MKPRHYYPGRKSPLRLIVIHTMEAPEGPQTARNIASYFARGSVVASAHVCVDATELIECLPPSAVAFAAPGANHDGYQIEHAGYARQTQQEWEDEYSQKMLRLSAVHARKIAQAHGIPFKHLTDAELARGEKGFCSHDQVSRVYKRSNHWDPGPNFPWKHYMNLVAGETPPADPVASHMQEGEITVKIIKTTTPWGSEAVARLHPLNGASALTGQAAASAEATYGATTLPWDWWNLEIRTAWEDHATYLRALGKEVTETVEEATQKIISAVKEAEK